MSARRAWEQELAAAEPQVQLDELVVAVNRLFHDAEAADYDSRHPEVLEQLPPLWRQMVAEGVRRLPAPPWRVLDFGCGTGFEAGQVLAAMRDPAGPLVAQLVCVDLSAAMVEQCRRSIAPMASAFGVEAAWATSVAEVAAPPGGFNVLLTNSLVHHLPTVTALLEQVEPLLTPRAVWLAGHEPSRRFYTNPECQRLLADYRRWRRSPQARLRRMWTKFRGRRWRLPAQAKTSPKLETARRAVDQGLFRRVPSPHLIDRLVDFQVAHDAREAQAGRGLDLGEWVIAAGDRWKLAWSCSYAYLGPHYEAAAPPPLRAQAAEVARRFPGDGANFCTVWTYER